MHKILIKNFMVFQEVLEAEEYDLVIVIVIVDEAWDVDHYWHEHPKSKKAPIAWFTDFVGNPDKIVPMGFGGNLPQMRDWIPKHFDFSGYIPGQHPDDFGEKAALRHRFGYREDEKICIVTVGGSGVGSTHIRRIL